MERREEQGEGRRKAGRERSEEEERNGKWEWRGEIEHTAPHTLRAEDGALSSRGRRGLPLTTLLTVQPLLGAPFCRFTLHPSISSSGFGSRMGTPTRGLWKRMLTNSSLGRSFGLARLSPGGVSGSFQTHRSCWSGGDIWRAGTCKSSPEWG